MAPDQGMHTIKLFISVFFANPNDGTSCSISSTILNCFSQLVLVIFKLERQCDMGILMIGSQSKAPWGSLFIYDSYVHMYVYLLTLSVPNS